MIELLLEKYLEGYKVTAKQITDVYVNPTRKELDQIDYVVADTVRFIADMKEKNIYVWDSGSWIHKLAWEKIKKTIGDSRQLYKDGSLLTGEVNWKTGATDMYYAANYFKEEDIDNFLKADWSWVDKYFKNFEKNMKADLTDKLEKKDD